MNDTLKFLIVVIVFSIILSIIRKYISTKIEKQLVTLVIDRDYQGFDELINSKKVKYFIRPFNIDFMKLNVALLKEDKKQVDDMFDRFDKVRPNKVQKEAVYAKGFYYYLTDGKYDKVEKYYELLQELNIVKNMNEFDRAYDVYVKNGSKYLEETLEELKTAPDFSKPVLEGLISKMYENRNDERMAKKYADKALRHMEELK
ncbi:MAG: hypothetical protein ACOX1F_06825 [Erysipelotrichaceae bacterium]|jgi:tetratricopeptide (TPR) repeat protein